MRTLNQPCRNPRGLCAAAILAGLSATAGAAPIFTENFNGHGLSQSSTHTQETTGLKLGNGQNLTSWTKAGDGAIHCVDRTGSGDWAVMFYGGNSAAGDNAITSPAIAAANTLNKSYRVTFDLSAANYQNTSQRNNGTTDGVTVTVLNSSGGTIKTQTFVPGSFASLASAGSLPFTTVSFDYVGTGSGTGAANLKFTATNPTSVGRFGGSIDNVSVSAGPTLASSGIVDDKGGASVTTGTVVTYTVTFSQDMDASTVSATSFGNAGTAGVSIGTVTETAPTSGVFTVPVTTTSAGTLQLKVNAGAVLKDAGGLPLDTTSAIADDTTLTVAAPGDTTPPTLTSIADDKGGATTERNALVTYTVTFNEAMNPATVTAAGFGNAGSATVTIGAVTPISATEFSVPVTPTTTGTLQLRVIAGAVLTDVAGNALVVPSPAGIPDDNTLAVADTIAPTLTGIVDDKSPATIAPNTLVTYTVTFSEDMDSGTVSTGDFGNEGTAAVTINSVTETTPTSGIFTVQATPTNGGTLRLQINAGAELKDAAGNALVTTSAILDDTTITVDGTPPTVASLSPADDAPSAVLNANLAVTFNEPIAIGTGNITLKNLSNATETTIAITDGTQVSVAGSVLTINPTADLAPAMSYAVRIDATAIKDLYGNFFAGIADDTTWNFTAGNLVAFTTVGTTTWTAPPGVTSVGVLVIGGGGGGGWHAGAGGGAGGLVYAASHAVSSGNSYSVTVGAGGLGSVNHGNPNCDPPTSGGSSSFDTLSAAGGGYGGYSTWAAHFPPAAGGSGGGGFMSTGFGADRIVGAAGTSGQGNAGANGSENVYSGGGGGAGAAGSTRNGGIGLDYSTVFGTGYGVSGWFAGGGGGGARTTGTAGTGGTGGGGAGAVGTGTGAGGYGLANTGGGGGGGGEGSGNGGNGGSGIVLLSIAGFTPPVVATLSPADNATGVADTANLVATFDQAVQTGTGNLEIRKTSDGSLIEAIDVTSGQVSISGAEVTINPSSNLPAGTECYVQIPAGAFTSASGSLLPFAGITDTTTWSFTTAGPPVIATLNPADNAVGVLVNTNLVVTFDQAVQAGTGNIEIRQSGDGSLIESIDVTSGLVTISGATATINPTNNLPLSTGCYVLVPVGTFTSTIGSLFPFAGITDDTTWHFTTGAVLADARADFRTTTAGGTTADFNGGTGISDTEGSGRWNYLNGAASTLLTFGGAGNAGKSMFMTPGQTNGLPVIGDQQIFGNVPAPAAGKIQWHAGTGTQNAVMRWTAGADIINLAIAGTITHGTVVGSNTPQFDILVNGTSQFTVSLPDMTPHTFNVTGLSISAGQHVDFVLSRGTGTNADGAIADMQATISGDPLTSPYNSWANGTFANGTLSDKTAGGNPDGDTLTNLQEYAFGTDPTVSYSGEIAYDATDVTTPGIPKLVEDGGMYYAVFGRRADYLTAGITYTVRFSADLENGYWVTSTEVPEDLTPATTGPIHAVRVPFPGLIESASGPQKARFFQVGVSEAP